jgi:polyphosphate kinase
MNIQLQPDNPSGAAEPGTDAAGQAQYCGTTPASPGLSSELPVPGPEGFDLGSPDLFLNRELTWLNFNWRVLHQAEDGRIPLLERLRFVAIVGSNLDEFLMKRIGGLKQQVGAGLRELTEDGRTPERQMQECMDLVDELRSRQRELLFELRDLLKAHGIVLADYAELDEGRRAWLREYFISNIFPLVTPQASDPAHPFPFVSNLSVNLLVKLRGPDGAALLNRVKAPIGPDVPGLIKVGDNDVFVTLEQVIANNLDLLFPGMPIESCEFFRVIRNANTERTEERADDLLAMIESELRERHFAPVVCMEVVRGMSSEHRGFLAAELGLRENSMDVTELEAPLNRAGFIELANLDYPDLRYPPHHPIDHPELPQDKNIFHSIREKGSVLLHHPYESFSSSIERFLKSASQDPKVRAIKMSLYRTGSNSRVVKNLVDAARNGKQVAVVVELKARFDERANIEWARHLEEAGIHVSYGVVGLKTHCKVIMVVRRDYDGLRRYCHFGTGNYHAGTARIYSDLGLLTCDPRLGEDLAQLFNYLTTGQPGNRTYSKVLLAPTFMKKVLLRKIEGEIHSALQGQTGLIQLKLNALEDAGICRALYRASMAGVRVDLLVRDTCRIRPGIPGLSENIRVVSIVGNFLEHSRIYHFGAQGAGEYYIGSADCMRRKLENRVEVLVPIEERSHRQELQEILDLQLNDHRDAWDMASDGSYRQRVPAGDPDDARGSQSELVVRARRRQVLAEAERSRGVPFVKRLGRKLLWED